MWIARICIKNCMAMSNVFLFVFLQKKKHHHAEDNVLAVVFESKQPGKLL